MKAAHLAVILAVAPVACSSEELHREVFVLGETGGPEAWEMPARVSVYPFRNDLHDENDGYRQWLYRLRFDGLDVVWTSDQDFEYVPIHVGNAQRLLPFPAGDHVLEVVPSDPGLPPMGGNVSLVRDQEYHLVAFGDPHAPQYRLFPDDPGTVPAGAVRVRLLNGLDSGQAIQPERCADSASPCGALGPPLAVGESFEIDEPMETVGQLVWRLVDGDTNVGGPMAMVFTSRQPNPFRLTALFHINAPTNPTCPSCVITQSQ